MFRPADLLDLKQFAFPELFAADAPVWEALRALYLVGQPDDLFAIERQAGTLGRAPDRVRQQAALTARAIRNRSEPNPNP